jgi:glyoxylase-like metal-dependent hydrolase (beta-lactamase superfamily II)
MAEALGRGTWYLDLGFPAPLGANAFVVDDGEVTLVDAGLPVGGPRLRRELGDAGVSVGDIDRVLLTHYDLDHVGGLSRLAGELDAPVYLGEADLGLLQGTWDPPWLHHKGLFHRGLRRVYRLPQSLDLRPVTDGDAVGGFRAHHTPGHNPGHTAWVHDSLGVALLGDLAWSKPGGLVTPIWLDSYDMGRLRASVRGFARRAPPFEVVGVGHGEPLRSGGDAAVRDLAARC